MVSWLLCRSSWPISDKVALERFIDLSTDDTAEPSRVFPGVRETLAGLAGAGVALGLCTNKPERVVRTLLPLLGLDGVFGAVAPGPAGRPTPPPAPLPPVRKGARPPE